MDQQIQKKFDELIPDKAEQARFIEFMVVVGQHMMHKGFALPTRWGIDVQPVPSAKTVYSFVVNIIECRLPAEAA